MEIVLTENEKGVLYKLFHESINNEKLQLSDILKCNTFHCTECEFFRLDALLKDLASPARLVKPLLGLASLCETRCIDKSSEKSKC